MWFPLCFVVVVALLVAPGGCQGDKGSQVYVVYMGAVPPRTSPDFLRQSHLRLVGTILKRCACSSASTRASVLVRFYLCACPRALTDSVKKCLSIFKK